MKANAHRCCRIMLTIVLAAAAAPAFSQEYQLGDVHISLHGAADYGTAIRTNDVDPQLVTIPNAKVLGIRSVGNTRNSDDGELNFRKPGEAVSTVLKGWVSLEARYHDLGVFVRGKGWYDFTLSDHAVPWGNYPNGLTSNTTLSDRGFDSRAKFSGAALQEAYVFGGTDIAGHQLDVRVGNQLIPWGLPSVFPGGLSVLNPIDIPALRRPGAFAEETPIPFPAVFARFAATPKLSVEGFWQFGEGRNVYDGCGTFYASDYFPQGCNYVLVGGSFASPDPVLLRQGAFITRAPTPGNSEVGQGGIGAKYTVDQLNSEFGAYYAHYNSRNALPEITRTFRTSAATPFITGNPDGGNPVFRTVYVPDVDLFAVNWQAKLPSKTTLAAEYVFRPNQPIGLPAGEELTAAVSAAAPSLLRASFNTLAPGAFYQGYDRHETGSLSVAAAQQFDNVAGAKIAVLGAEFGARQVYDLPDPNVRRYLRADTFGSGPVKGVCLPPTPGVLYTGCTLSGFVTKFAWGFRIRGSLAYTIESVPGLDFIATASYGKDISGWSYDGTFNQGRNVATVGVRSEYKKSYFGEIVYAPTWGGAFNASRDRSVVLASIGARF